MNVKFRAYDKYTNKMIYSDKLDDEISLDYCFHLNENGDNMICEVKRTYVEETPYTQDVIDDWIPLDNIMQFTGLKDKYGNDIYTDDILKYEDSNYGYGGIYDKEHDGYCYVKVPNIDILLNGNLDFPFYDGYMKHCIVIGNIHENHELLDLLR